MTINVTLYSRKDCHLCELARDDLNALREKYPHDLFIIDVDDDKDLQQAYGFEVPVVEVGPYRLKAPFTRQEIEMTLGAAIDRKNQLVSLNKPQYSEMIKLGQRWTMLDSLTYWLSKHYLLLFNLFVVIYVGLPFLAPVIMRAGKVTPAKFIYQMYGLVCHQLAFRSFFLFGEQLVYPRSAAGIDHLLTYQDVTGFSEDSNPENLYIASHFLGNDKVGYKVALCERDVAIYFAILLFGIIYPLTGRRLPSLHWILWIVIGLVPIGVDGLSQLISQPPFGFLPFRESTPFLRVLTGGLFGFTTAWFGYPLVEQTMQDSRRILAAKFLRLK